MDDEVKAQVDECLSKARVMQVATTSGGQPWICSVYFVANDRRELYWLSWPQRRHSQELAQSPKAAIAIAYKTDLPVIGLQAEGVVDHVSDLTEITEIMERYIGRYNAGKKFVENFQKGVNEHVMYRLRPTKFVLFDELHFAESPRKEIIL